MILSEINPYIRYARYMNLGNDAYFNEVIPLDTRLFYSVKGYGKIKVRDLEYEMSPHSLLIINSGIPYQISAPEESVDYIAINFDYTQKAASLSTPINPVIKSEFKKEMLTDFNNIDDVDVLSKVLYINKINSAQKKLNTIVQEYMQKLLHHEQKSGHLLAECIIDALRFEKIKNVAIKNVSFDEIVSYIHNHYCENITNQLLGTLFGYHPNYVSFLIKQITGMPLHKYVIYVRLMNAVNYLENTTLSVSEIASACGFCDAAYFSGYFKKHFGTSPSKYRNV